MIEMMFYNIIFLKMYCSISDQIICFILLFLIIATFMLKLI